MVEKIEMFRSNYLFYYEDNEENKEEITSEEQVDLTSSYWMPLSLNDLSKSAIEKLTSQPDV